MAFLTQDQIDSLGLKSVGKNVKISETVRFYQNHNIVIGDNVRIDDFCTLSNSVNIGNYVHIAAYTFLMSSNTAMISFGDFSGASLRVSIISSSDDYSGEHLMGPIVPYELRKMREGHVRIEPYAVIGMNSVLLPNASLSEGTALGAMSMLDSKTFPWSIYTGIPARKIAPRSKNLLKLKEEMMRNLNAQ